MVEIEAIEIGALANMFVVVGIPAYNEERTIARVVLEAQKFAKKIVVCDDGSTDYTAEIAQGLGAEVIRHEKNYGYGASIKSLFLRAQELNADIFVTLDADGQHEPNEIPRVIKPILEGTADVVIGSRFVNEDGTKEMPLYRQFGVKLITKLVNGSSKNGVTDAQSGFRAYSHQALDCLNFFEVGMGASVEILLKASKHELRILEVPSTCKYNNGDVATSTENPVTHGIGIILSIIKLVVEDKPLLFLGVPGIVSIAIGVWFGVWMMSMYASSHQIVTNVALASISFILIGFFALSTAIMLYAISRLSKKINHSK